MKQIAKITSLIITLLCTEFVFGQMTFNENFVMYADINLKLNPKFQKYLNYIPTWVHSWQKITEFSDEPWIIRGFKEGTDTIDFSSTNNTQWTRFIVTYHPAIKKEIEIICANDTIPLAVNEERFIGANTFTFPSPLNIKWLIKDPSIAAIKNTAIPQQIMITGKQAGTTILYAIKSNVNQGPGSGPGGNLDPNRPENGEIFDSCIVIVGKLPLCNNDETKLDTIAYCKNETVKINSNNGIVNWYQDKNLEQLLSRDSILSLQLTTSIDVYLSQNKTTCQSILSHITIKAIDKPIITGLRMDKIDTTCLGTTIGVLSQFNDLKIFDTNNKQLQASTFTKTGLQSMYLQIGTDCKSDLTQWSIYVRDCSHDFVARYFITGQIHADGIDSASVFLIDKVITDRYIDSCKINIKDSFKLRVPKAGKYTVLVEPENTTYTATYYGNKSTERRAAFIPIDDTIPVNSYIENLDIYLIKDENTSTNLGESNLYSVNYNNKSVEVTSNSDQNYEVQIFSIDGRIITTAQNIAGCSTISLARYSSEIIVVRIITDGKTAFVTYIPLQIE